MRSCERSGSCGFFNDELSAARPADERLRFKVRYCMKDKTKCARYIVIDRMSTLRCSVKDSTKSAIDERIKYLYPDDIIAAGEILRAIQD